MDIKVWTYKGRLVANVFNQVEWVDYMKTIAPVAMVKFHQDFAKLL